MLLSLYLLFFYNNAFNQNTIVVDSLLQVLQIQKKDTVTVNTLNELAWEFRKSDSTKAIDYASKAKELSDSLLYVNGKLTSLNRLGVIAIYQKNYKKAEEIYLNIFSEELQRKNEYGIGRAANQLGTIYIEKDNLEKALEFELIAYKKFKLLNKKNSLADASNSIGNIYRQLGNLKLAMKYFLKSLDLKKELGDKNNNAALYQNIGILCIDFEHYNEAKKYLLKSEKKYNALKDEYELATIYNNLSVVYFKLYNYDISLDYHKKSIRLKNKLKINNKEPKTYNNLGAIHYKKGNYKLALENYLKSIKLENNIKKQKYSDAYSNIGHIYYRKKEYNKAMTYYNKSLVLAKKSNRILDVMSDLNDISNTYSKLKQYNLSVTYNIQYLKLRDSVKKNYIAATILKADYEEKQKQIILKQANIEKVEAENKQKNTVIYWLITGFILVILSLYLYIRGYKQKQTAKKKQAKVNQKIEELLKNQESKSINAMLDGREKERKRIATDLHDRLGGMLSMVKIHYKSVEDNINIIKEENKKQYKKANKLLDEACDEVRKIAYDMVSGVLSNFGLIAALEDLTDKLNESNQIEVEFFSHGLKNRLDFKLEVNIYRIIQELISNILKKSKASEVTIQLIKSELGLNITVEDNGIGFKVNKVQEGMGLKNVAARIDEYDGELQIDSTINKGTTITIDIPLKNN